MERVDGFNFSFFTKISPFTLNASEVVVDFNKVKAKSKWGVIPFQVDTSGKVRVLIISTRRKNWSFPKGNLIPKIGPQRTALLEAYEEAGIDGSLGAKPLLCSIGRICIYLFPMEVTKFYDDWPESDFRKRKWIQVNQAKEMLHHREMRKILKNFFPKKS